MNDFTPTHARPAGSPEPLARRPSPARPQPLLAVRDVKASSAWYTILLGAESLPDHPHRLQYDRLSSGGSLILQLHRWDDEGHPNLMERPGTAVGHGALVWFEVDDFDAAVERARSLRATVVLEPHVNPAPAHRELWLRDPDGYHVVLASPDGEADLAGKGTGTAS